MDDETQAVARKRMNESGKFIPSEKGKMVESADGDEWLPPLRPTSPDASLPRRARIPPFAIRYAPTGLGLRIRGARPLKVNEAAEALAKPPGSTGPVNFRSAKTTKASKPIRREVLSLRSLAPGVDPFTPPELAPGADPRSRNQYLLEQFDHLRRKSSVEKKAKEDGDVKIVDVLKPYYRKEESTSGDVLGVRIGDYFRYRMELVIVGLHGVVQAGIAFVGEEKGQFHDSRSGKAVTVAVSVVASGGYDDKEDGGGVLIYGGQGGNNAKNSKGQAEDQTLEKGNLGLYNCERCHFPVRVVKTLTVPTIQSPSGKIYYYDGLYNVVKSYQETGAGGAKVWKFKLVRCPGQEPLASRLLLSEEKNALPLELEQQGQRILSTDLSNGLEKMRVRLVGIESSEVSIPSNFTYIVKMRRPFGLMDSTRSRPCACKSVCRGFVGSCSCSKLNGGLMPYTKFGTLVKAKRLVFECGKNCKCNEKCQNRVTQEGLRFNLEVFQNQVGGWGLRSSNFIPQGSFICEILGEIIEESDAQHRLSNQNYKVKLRIPREMERRFGDVSDVLRQPYSGDCDEEDDKPSFERFTVDATKYGNVARFINHNTSPNLFVQCVLWDHHDRRHPHMMLFSLKHIAPFTELTRDYGDRQKSS